MYAYSIDYKFDEPLRWVKLFTDAETEKSAERSLKAPIAMRKENALVNFQDRFIFSTGGIDEMQNVSKSVFYYDIE